VPLISEAKTLVLPACEEDLPDEEIHRRIGLIVRVGALSDAALAFYLRRVERRGIYRRYGYPNIAVYADREHGVPEGKTYRLVRASKACEKSPLLRKAFEEERVDLSKLDIVQPMLKGTDEDAPWVEKAATMTRNDLEAEVKRALGLEPNDVVVTFRCTASQLERINAGLEKCRSVMSVPREPNARRHRAGTPVWRDEAGVRGAALRTPVAVPRHSPGSGHGVHRAPPHGRSSPPSPRDEPDRHPATSTGEDREELALAWSANVATGDGASRAHPASAAMRATPTKERAKRGSELASIRRGRCPASCSSR